MSDAMYQQWLSGERDEVVDDGESGEGSGVGVSVWPCEGREAIRCGYSLLTRPYQFEGMGLYTFVQYRAT